MTGIMRVSKMLREVPREALDRAKPEWWFKTFEHSDAELTLSDVAEAIEAEKRGRK